MTSISNLGIQLFSVNSLQNQLTNLNSLNEQLGSGHKQSNLTDYAPLDAVQLVNFQNSIIQRQAYVTTMGTVSARLKVYNDTMADMENIAKQANQLATQNPTLNATQTGNIQQQIQAYMKQTVDDLNQQVGNRYIYAGTRYSTSPVSMNAVLNGTPTSSFVSANNLPPYDSGYTATNSLTVNTTPTGSFQVGNTAVKWSDLASGGTLTTIYVNNTPTALSPSLNLPNTPPGSGTLTPTQLAENLAYVVTTLGASSDPAATAFAGLSGTSTGSGGMSLAVSGNSVSITPDIGGGSGDITWQDGTPGTTAEGAVSSSPAAWAQTSATIDTGDTLTYGVTSTQLGFQQLIAGMQYINAATQTGVTAAQYQSDMQSASNLLSQALSNIETYNTGVAASINTITQEQTTQSNDITNLQEQIGNIQNVDIAQVGTEINTLQTQLQASYSATAMLTQESLLKYL